MTKSSSAVQNGDDQKYFSHITYGLKDSAAVSGLSVSTLYRHAKAGRLRLVKVGARTLVDAASLLALLGVDNPASAASHETSQTSK
jgi:hypothetical protein